MLLCIVVILAVVVTEQVNIFTVIQEIWCFAIIKQFSVISST